MYLFISRDKGLKTEYTVIKKVSFKERSGFRFQYCQLLAVYP